MNSEDRYICVGPWNEEEFGKKKRTVENWGWKAFSQKEYLLTAD